VNVLFLIPARGGSKGFPGKNLAPLAGIPLVGRSARLARRTSALLGGEHRVVCSTDDPSIAGAAQAWGAELPFLRPAELASDTASSLEVLLHALASLRPAAFDRVVLLQPTSPLAEPEDVLGTLELSLETGDPAVSVCRAEHPAHWQFRMDGSGILSPLLRDERPDRRQEAAPCFRLNGAVYAASPEQIASLRGFLGPATRGYEMPVERSVDVDEPTDLAVARALLEAREVPCIEVAGRRIGPGQPCFIIAEAGVNHNGDLETALRLVDVAAEAGADAVKFQTFKAERLVTPDAPKADYQLRTTDPGESQIAMLRGLELSEAMHRALVQRCRERGILFLSTPFDEESCDLLTCLGVAALKLPSGELTNLPLMRHAARKGLPLIVSTGMATLEETARCVEALRGAGCSALALLHCVSNYPAAPADSNLRAMVTLREAFGVPSGFSDHTDGDAVSVAAAALGANILEKHFTLDRTLPGPDHKASIEPDALRSLIRNVRAAEACLGTGVKVPAPSEGPVARVARKSLVAAETIPAGAVLQTAMVVLRRPGTGMAPGELDTLLGKRARTEITSGTLLEREMFE